MCLQEKGQEQKRLSGSDQHCMCCVSVCGALQEAQVKIRELEGHVKDEKGRVQQEKKDQAEQLKAHKAEIKSLIDKVDR